MYNKLPKSSNLSEVMFQCPPKKIHVASRKNMTYMTLSEEQKLKLQIETRSEEVKVWSGQMVTDHEAKKYNSHMLQEAGIYSTFAKKKSTI